MCVGLTVSVCRPLIGIANCKYYSLVNIHIIKRYANFYSLCFRDKSKRCAEQATAVVCLKVLDVDYSECFRELITLTKCAKAKQGQCFKEKTASCEDVARETTANLDSSIGAAQDMDSGLVAGNVNSSR